MRPVIQGILCALVGMLIPGGFSNGAGLPWWTGKAGSIMVGAAVALIPFRVNLLLVVVAAACLSLFIY